MAPPPAPSGGFRQRVRLMQTFDGALDAMGAYASGGKSGAAKADGERERAGKEGARMQDALARMRLADAVASDEAARTAMMNVLLLVVLCDTMGVFLMTAVTPRIYNEAPSGTSRAARDAGVGVFYDEAKDFPLGGLSAAFQYGQVVNLLAAAVANFFAGRLTKAVGRKNALFAYTFGGGVASILAATSGWLGWSMYTYWGMRALMGFFAGSQPVATMYIADLYANADPATKQKKLMAPMQMGIIAVLLGPLIGMGFVATGLVFMPLVVGGALEFFAFILVVQRVPAAIPALKQDDFVAAKADVEGGAKKAADGTAGVAVKPPRTFLAWVAVFWASRLADRAALGQFQYLQTAGVKRWGTVALDLLPVLVVILSILGVVCLPFIMKLNARIGPAYTAGVGQGVAGAMFFVMSEMSDFYAFSGVLFVLQCFTMAGAFLVTPTLLAIVPPASRDHWLGYQTAFTQVTSALAPLIANPVLERELEGSVAGGSYLRTNGIICLASAALYLVLSRKIGVPPKVTPEMKEAEAAMKKYEETGDPRDLTADQFTTVQKQKMMAGEEVPVMDWTTYDDDAAYYGRGLTKMKETAVKDFAAGRKRLPERLAMFREAQKDPEKMKEYVNGLRALNDQGFTRWTDQHKRDLGQWFSDYLEANGYMNPTTNQRLFKTVIMSAFPPLGDGKACDTWEGYIANPVPTWFLIDAWMAGHLKLQSMTDRDFEAYSKVRMNTSILLPGMS